MEEKMDAGANPRPKKNHDARDEAGEEGGLPTSSMIRTSVVGEQPHQPTAASHPKLSRPHVHGEVEEGRPTTFSATSAGDQQQLWAPPVHGEGEGGTSAGRGFWIARQLSLGRNLSLPRNRAEIAFHVAAAAAALGADLDVAVTALPSTAAVHVAGPSSSSSAAASTGARGSVEVQGEDGAAAAPASPPPAAAGPNAAALPPPAGVNLNYKQTRTAVRQELQYYWMEYHLSVGIPEPEPLKLQDDSTFRQLAAVIQDMQGTAMDLANLSGANALRLVLPDGTNFGRGNLGLYRAAVLFLKANVHVE